MQDATCIVCGEPGAAKRPEVYRCPSCFFTARADGNERVADKLVGEAAELRNKGKDGKASVVEVRIQRLRREASEFRARADEYKAGRHG